MSDQEKWQEETEETPVTPQEPEQPGEENVTPAPVPTEEPAPAELPPEQPEEEVSAEGPAFEDLDTGAESIVSPQEAPVEAPASPAWEPDVPAAPAFVPPQAPAQPVPPSYPEWQAQQQAAWQQPPQGGYYYPPQGAPTGYYQPPQPPVKAKKKMSTGLIVFLVVALSLTLAAVGGFGVYALLNRGDAPQEPQWIEDLPEDGENPFGGQFPFGGGNTPFGGTNPFSGRGDDDDSSSGSGNRPHSGSDTPSQGGDDEEEQPTPDFGVTPPDADDPQPEIDTTPSGEKIEIHQPGTREMAPAAVYEKVVDSTVTVASTLEKGNQVASGVGTGIVATEDGYIITNAHVVLNSKSTRVNIITSDGEEHAAVVVGVDKTTDLAVLKTDAKGLKPAEFGDSDKLVIGQQVFAIGNPGGIKYTGSLTGGYISGLDREAGKYSENGMTYIQTDAAINPGNSGGPLVNLYGQVVGINSSKIVSANYESMSFAIPVTKAKEILDQLMNGGYVEGRVRIGISGFDVSDTQYVIMAPLGFMISEINEESSFTGTDAQPGDIITAVDGVTVSNLEDISNQLLKYAPGDKVTVTLYRLDGEKSFDVEITLLEDKGETQR